MRYTITAHAPSAETVEVMRQSLLAVGAPRDAIRVDPGSPGAPQPQITVKTDDLEASESYRDALELAGGLNVAANEESSAFTPVDPAQPRSRRPEKDPGAPKAPPARIWQERGKWLVQLDPAATVLSFPTREEAIAYSTSVFSDGRSAARAETQRGDVPLSDKNYKQQA